MKRKAITLMLAGVMAVSTVSYGTTVWAAEDSVKDNEVSNAEDEQITLEFINGSAEEQYVAWLDEVIAGFEEENPNIKIEIQKTSIDSFNQTVMTRFAAGDVPDLFSFSANDMDDMVPSGYVLDLSASANMENYSDGMLDTFTKDGKTYALPIANDFMCVTYNKSAFEAAGIDKVPETWSEFLDACKKLQEADIVPIASGFSEQWVVNGTSQTVYCAQVLGNDGPTLASMVDRTNKFAETEQWKGFFTKLQDIYPYMNTDPFGTDQNTCYSLLANAEAGMILNGTWTVTNATAMNPEAELGIFALPISDNAEDNVMPMCPPESAVAVAAESSHAEEAVKFLEYMMSPESASLYAEKGAGIPIIKGVDTSNLTGAFKDAADIMNSGEVKVISSKSFPSANEDAFINDVSEFFLDGCEDTDAALETLDTDFDNLVQ
ncbi:MAG: extracellular solute-binding protein [Eubacteriales bacterium]|nr:extracellular solute-binding protein [Eubacteriales bacterium]